MQLAEVIGLGITVIGAAWHLSAKISRVETKVEALEKRLPAEAEAQPARKKRAKSGR